MPIFGTDGAFLSRRCTMCSVQYPPNMEKCPICGQITWGMRKSGPDTDWRDKVSRALGDAEEEQQKIAYAPQHPSDLEIAFHIDAGKMWVPHAVLIDSGYSLLEDGSVVFINNRFYELQGYSYSRKMWWVEEFEVDGIFDDITPEDIINGG